MSDPNFLRFKKHLKTSGNFCTVPRMRLFGVLQHHPNLTIKEIIDLVDKHDPATVYRNISLFERLGVITVTKYGWTTRIELTDDYNPHHHHISCSVCGAISAMPDSKSLESAITEYMQKTDYVAHSHKLEIQGICKKCQKLLGKNS